MSKKSSPILITGSHCSGTTWAGRMIAASPLVTYIHEPFNLHHDPGVCGAKFDYWFTYVTDENASNYYHYIHKMLAFHYNCASRLRTTKHLGMLVNCLRYYFSFLVSRFRGVRPLVKDPIAVFSAEWLASEFDMDVVVMIRHPAAFAGSLKVRNWSHPFSHFLKQPLLMRDLLHPFEDQIMRFAQEEQDIVDQAALLWKLIYFVVLNYKDRHPNWIFVRHEDLANDPLNGFRSLFSKLGLQFSNRVVSTIKWHSFSSESDRSKTREQFNPLRRDSTSTTKSWKTRLTAAEVERIKAEVQDVSQEFYSEQEW